MDLLVACKAVWDRTTVDVSVDAPLGRLVNWMQRVGAEQSEPKRTPRDF